MAYESSTGTYVVPYFSEPAAVPAPKWGGPSDGYFAGKFEWPMRSLSSEGLTNGVRVSTEALRTFANNLRMMLDPLYAAKAQIEQVKLAPGAFWHAFDLMERVVGRDMGEAIQPNTLDFINKAIQAITITADELERLASAYATAEELNAATGQDLGEHIESAKDYLTTAIGGPTGLS